MADFPVGLPHAYEPPPRANPPPELAAIQGQISDTGEAYAQQFEWKSTGGEFVVYTTRRQWRACDVYLSQPGAQGPKSVFTVRVYALFVGGLRTLVATGRLGKFNAIGVGLPPKHPVWIAAARAQATRFEVTVEYAQGGPGSNAGVVSVGVCASNEANDPPAWVGAVRCSHELVPALTTQEFPDPELVMVQGIVPVGIAAPRFLHVHDRDSTITAGLPPSFCFPLGVGAGGGSFFLHFRSQGLMTIQVSSTAAVTTAVLDCLVQAMIR